MNIAKYTCSHINSYNFLSKVEKKKLKNTVGPTQRRDGAHMLSHTTYAGSYEHEPV